MALVLYLDIYSHCQKCSNADIFIIVPIAILGVLLVVLLFFLNLTVADGTINAFILYVNILSINSTVFFHSHDTTLKAAYIFISISNLDMGIQRCFYDGMDDYTMLKCGCSFCFLFILFLLLQYSSWLVDTLQEYRDSLHGEHYQYLPHYSYCLTQRYCVLYPVFCSPILILSTYQVIILN